MADEIVSMDADAVRRYRGRWQAVAEIEAAEQRAATLAERWQLLNHLLSMALALGLDLNARDDEDGVRRRWLKLKGAA